MNLQLPGVAVEVSHLVLRVGACVIHRLPSLRAAAWLTPTLENRKVVNEREPDVRARAGGGGAAGDPKAERAAGRVVLDSETVLEGVPAEAWGYQLGNRSGVEWVLDQHKEKAPRDPTIRERFNGYRFADHKERVVELIGRVARVWVETMEVVAAMAAVGRGVGGRLGGPGRALKRGLAPRSAAVAAIRRGALGDSASGNFFIV